MLTGHHTSATCVFLLFFLLTPVSLQCWNATAVECQADIEPVPGHDLIGRGIDITTMQSSDFLLLNIKELVRADGTCILCNNTALKSEPTQMLPLAVIDWVSYPVCHRELLARVKYHAVSLVKTEEFAVNNEWKKELNLPLDSDQKAPVAFAGSHSNLADFSKTKSSQDRFIFSYLSSNCSYYMLQVSENPTPTDTFIQAVDNLPEIMDPTAEVGYTKVIETFGTHFTKKIHLGGLWKEAAGIRLCEMQLDNLDLYTVIHCLKSDFNFILGFPQVSRNILQICGKLLKILHSQAIFHERFKDRYIEIKGGASQSELLSAHLNTTYYMQWLHHIKEEPAVISYDIEPIYKLVATTTPRRTNLQTMLERYVKDRAMQKHCPLTCKEGTHFSDLLSCSCKCVPNSMVSSWCCTNKRGMASVVVTIDYAHDLYGDYFSAADAYVILTIQEMRRLTKIVWDNNSPIWFESFPFGHLDLLQDYAVLRIEVYDKDNGPLEGWIDDHLGMCQISLGSGHNQQKLCVLEHGSLYYHYDVICGPHLKGSDCFSYEPYKAV